MAFDFRIRDFFYPTELYRMGRSLAQSQWWSSDALETYQMARLRHILHHASRQVPYYRDMFRRHGWRADDFTSLQDLSKIPVLDKFIIREKVDRFRADNYASLSPREYRTSGTTGAAMRFYLDKHARALEFAYYRRHWGWAGFRLGTRFAELGSVFFLNRPRRNTRIFSWQPVLRRLMINSARISYETAPAIAAALRSYRPRFLKGSASTLYALSTCLHHQGIDDLHIRAVFSANEMLTPHFRHRIESTFHCRVLDSYGQMEGVVAISQCPEGSYHVNADYGIMEVDSSSGIGENIPGGRIIGTGLYNMAMPFIRYDTGDTVELFADAPSCPCGRTLPLVKAIHGRSQDIIVTPDGRHVSSLYVLPEFIRGADNIQFIQERQDTLSVLVVTGPGWRDRDDMDLRAHLRRILGDQMKVDIRQVSPEELVMTETGKFRPVISLIHPANAEAAH